MTLMPCSSEVRAGGAAGTGPAGQASCVSLPCCEELRPVPSEIKATGCCSPARAPGCCGPGLLSETQHPVLP